MILSHQVTLCVSFIFLLIASQAANFDIVKYVNESRGVDEFYLIFKHHFRLIEDADTVTTLGFDVTQLANWTSHHFVGKHHHIGAISLIKDDRSNPDAFVITEIKRNRAVVAFPLTYDYIQICNGCKNPAVVKWHDQLLAVSEVTSIRGDVLHIFWVNVSILPIKDPTLFGITMQANEKIAGEVIPGTDARINHNVLTNGVEIAYFPRFRYPLRMALSELNIGSDKLANYSVRYEAIVADQQDFPREKNWAPFYYNDSLHFVQSVNPLHVVSVHPTADGKYLQAKTISKELANVDWKYGQLRGGTNAVRLADRYIALFHSIGDLGSSYKTYFFGAYAFSLHPPFRIIAISAVPIMDELMYSGPWYSHKGLRYDYVPYPMSLFLEKKGVLLMSFGMNDVRGYICRINVHDLLESMVPVHYS